MKYNDDINYKKKYFKYKKKYINLKKSKGGATFLNVIKNIEEKEKKKEYLYIIQTENF